jgi:hypothetical protein
MQTAQSTSYRNVYPAERVVQYCAMSDHPPPTDDASSSFYRQRRDLFVISSLLLLAQFAQPDFKDLTLLGLGIHLKNPDVVGWAMWILWSYWLLRYIQSYNALTESPRHTIRGLKIAAREAMAKRFGRRLARRSIAHIPEFRGAILIGVEINRIAISPHDYIPLRADAILNNEPFTLPVADFPITWKVRWIADVQSVLQTLFLLPAGTEYWLPPIYALAPFLLALSRMHSTDSL